LDSQFKTNNFDLLRILAASQVVVTHTLRHLQIARPAWWSVVEAFPGVAVFFVISGFLLSASFERSSDWKSYARNRILRIYPGLWCCVFTTILVAYAFGYSFLNWSAPLWVITQLVGAIYTPQFLKSFGFGSYNGSLWTIPIELQFYCALPVLYWVTRKVENRTLCFSIIWVCFVLVAFVSCLVFVPFGELQNEPVLQKLFQYSFMPHIYLFLTGVLMQRMSFHKMNWIAGKAVYWVIAYLAVYLFIPYSAASYVLKMLMLGVAAVSGAYTRPGVSRKLLHGNDISYGVYIYHGLLINAFIELGLVRRGTFLVLLALCAYVAGYLSWIGIERPFLRSKKHSISPVYAPVQ
jgi:peptidoglycan/LPS O-acetylase OafA/YrhL